MTLDGSLHAAANIGDVLELENLWFWQRDINRRSSCGAAPLHYSAFSNAVECTKFILNHGGSPNTADSAGFTPLHIAAWKGNLETVKLLLVDPSTDLNARNKQSYTPLHYATLNGHENIIEQLLLRREVVEVNCRNDQEQTPLHLASSIGNVKCCKLLVEGGAEVNCKDVEGATPLHKATFLGHAECVSFLLDNKADCLTKDSTGSIPLHTAATHGKIGVIDLLMTSSSASGAVAYLDVPDGEGATPLHHSVFSNQVECTRRLILLGAKVDHRDNNQVTSLHKAAFNGFLECASVLVENGAKVDVQDDEGAYPIHKAAYNGHVGLIRFLLEKGSDLDWKDSDGTTCMHKAAFRGRSECMTIMIIKGASVDPIDSTNSTPLHFAVQSGFPECAKILLDRKASVNAVDVRGQSPLHTATMTGAQECVEILLEKGADVNLEDSEGKSPLLIAVKKGHDGCIQALIKKGAIFSEEDKVHISSPEFHAGGGGVYGSFGTAEKLLEFLKEKFKEQTLDEAKRQEIRELLTQPFVLDPSKMEEYKTGVALFNQKPLKGIDLLAKAQIIPTPSPIDIAIFLHRSEDLQKRKIGEYLGEQDAVNAMNNFIDFMNFASLDFDIALRRLLNKFLLPGEAQKIDRIMKAFASRYFNDNPTGFITSPNTGYVLAFAVIMLNTDAHSSNVKKETKMTKQEFIKHVHNAEAAKDIPGQFLEDIYQRIVEEEIKMHEEGSASAAAAHAAVINNAEKKGWITFRGSKRNKYSAWKRRWFILSDSVVYYYKKPGVCLCPPLHLLPLFTTDFSALLLLLRSFSFLFFTGE
jgi:ankyrin repeat protein